MARISVDANDEWLAAARQELGTDSAQATIDAALAEFARRKRAKDLIATLQAVEMDFSRSAEGWRYGGGRDLSRLAERAREGRSEA
jgi:hypothetical protein